MTIPLALLIGTIIAVLALVAWVIYLNIVDYRNNNTIGREFDEYSGREEERPRRGRFRSED